MKKTHVIASFLLAVILVVGGYLVFQQYQQTPALVTPTATAPAEVTAQPTAWNPLLCPEPTVETVELSSPARFDLRFSGPCADNIVELVNAADLEPQQFIIPLQLEGLGHNTAGVVQLKQGLVATFGSVVTVGVDREGYRLRAFPHSSNTTYGYMTLFFVPRDVHGVEYDYDTLAEKGHEIICDYYPELGAEYCE